MEACDLLQKMGWHISDQSKKRMRWESTEELMLPLQENQVKADKRRQDDHLTTRRCVPYRADLGVRLDDRRRPGLGYFGKNDFNYVGSVNEGGYTPVQSKELQ